MSGRGGRGASPRVQTALGWNGVATEAPRTQVASCLMCGAELRFTTGEYGQTLEICTKRGCVNAVPHRPQPDLSSNPAQTLGANLMPEMLILVVAAIVTIAVVVFAASRDNPTW